MKHFSPQVNSMFVNKLVKKTTKRTTIPSFSRSPFSRKVTLTDKAGAVKVSWKITTQHGQLIYREIFTKDNTEPN